jgi:PAS domain S-box-containing protein
VSTLLSGFKVGIFMTVLSVVSSYYIFPPSIRQSGYYIVLIIFLIQGTLFSFLIEIFLRLLRRLRRQADLLALTTDAVIVRDILENSILYWSSGAEKIYGYTKEEAVGKNVYELLQPTPHPHKGIETEIMQNGSWEGELIHLKKNNHKIIVQSRWILKKNDQDKPAVIVEINTDITTKKSLEKRKDEFLSIASHELKTPVTSIKAFTQILEQRFKKLNDKTSQLYLSKMNTQLNRLTNLVNDLLDSTRIDAGKLELNTEFFRIDSLVDEVIENIQLTSAKHEIIKKGSIREMVWADRDRTEQVLINLINNAIKYSPRSDKVFVHLSEERGIVKIGVEDRGIGIPKDKIHKIFSRFYRVESREGEFTGLGLGLFISAEIVRRQNGQMWVESEDKIGSTFYFTLLTQKPKS